MYHPLLLPLPHASVLVRGRQKSRSTIARALQDVKFRRIVALRSDGFAMQFGARDRKLAMTPLTTEERALLTARQETPVPYVLLHTVPRR
jgi:hypothetical protein